MLRFPIRGQDLHPLLHRQSDEDVVDLNASCLQLGQQSSVQLQLLLRRLTLGLVVELDGAGQGFGDGPPEEKDSLRSQETTGEVTSGQGVETCPGCKVEGA